MPNNKKLGDLGEQFAKKYLLEQGYTIVETNWTFGHKEIDLIAKQDDIYIFIEVKTRRPSKFGHPEEAVNEKKVNHVTQAALQYLENKSYKDIRFDIISIVVLQEDIKDFLHIKDAFY